MCLLPQLLSKLTLHPAVLHKMFNVSALLLDNALLKCVTSCLYQTATIKSSLPKLVSFVMFVSVKLTLSFSFYSVCYETVLSFVVCMFRNT